MLRIDDIPQQVADDIQGSRLDLFAKCEIMIILITGASHTGKTALAQKLLVK